MRVNELSKQIGKSNKEVLEILQKNHFDVKSHSSKVTGIGHLMITLFATLVQIPIRVVISYALFGQLGIQAVAIGTTIGWACMVVFELLMYRRYGRVEALRKNDR